MEKAKNTMAANKKDMWTQRSQRASRGLGGRRGGLDGI